MNYQEEHFPEYDCDMQGNVYHNSIQITPFKSNQYLQVCQFDIQHKKHVYGVHTVIAMKYQNYYEGCVVHHKDGNCHNNTIDNLEVMSRSEHGRMHGLLDPKRKEWSKRQVSWNKGKKMSAEFCQHCSEAAKRRWQRKKSDT